MTRDKNAGQNQFRRKPAGQRIGCDRIPPTGRLTVTSPLEPGVAASAPPLHPTCRSTPRHNGLPTPRRLRTSMRCLTRSRPCTRRCAPASRSATCWPTTREPGRATQGEDPYGGDFLSRVAGALDATRNRRFKKLNDALRIAVPQLEDLELVRDPDGRHHLQARYKHWRVVGARQDERDFSDGTSG